MMKICFIIPSNKVCSPNNIALTIAKGLADKNDVTILYLRKNKGEALGTVTCNMRKMVVKDFFKLPLFDVVHSHLLKPDLLNALSSLFCRRGKPKRISTIHSNILLDLSTYIRSSLVVAFIAKIWFVSLNLLDCRVVVSANAGCNQRQYLKNYTVIHNGISPFLAARYLPKPAHCVGTTQRIRIGILSRLHPGKGIEDAFYIAEKLSFIDIHIFGAGKLEALCKYKESCHQNITFHGYKKIINEVFRQIDILLVPSRHEGFGMTVLESIKYSTPVMCFDIPVFREILGQGDYYYRNEESLLSLITRYKENYGSIQKEQKTRLSLFSDLLMIEAYKKIYN